MIKTVFASVIAASISLPAVGAIQEYNGFVTIASANNGGLVVYGKKQSGRFSNTKAGKAIYVAMTMWSQNNSLTHYQTYVTLSSCVEGMGEFVNTDVNGIPQSKYPFVIGGPTVADIVGYSICEAAKAEAAEAAERENKARQNDSI